MAYYTVGLFVLMALFTVSLAVRGIAPNDPDYQGLCPPGNKSANVLTKDRCDLRTYVMCFKGRPLFISQCNDLHPRFNQEFGYCDYEQNVPIPRGCIEDSGPPASCSMGANTLANKETCRSYWVCVGETKFNLPCNKNAFYINGRCRFDMFPFNRLIDQRELMRCRDLDPWPLKEEEKTV